MKNSKTESKAMKLLPLSVALFVGGIAALLSWTPPADTPAPLPIPAPPPPPPAPKPSATPTPSSTPVPNPTQTTTPLPTTVNGTFTGSTIKTQFGPVQVQVTIVDNTITDVKALQFPNSGRSATISQQAIPTLIQQVYSAQSSNINGVSGASYTSQGFYDSLYSALTKAGL
jgi:uncharacterized protein with FMN-binding domain